MEESRARVVFPLPEFDVRLQTLVWDGGDGLGREIPLGEGVLVCLP